MIENAGKGKTIVKNADKNSKSVREREIETVAVEKSTVWCSFAKFLSLVSLPF